MKLRRALLLVALRMACAGGPGIDAGAELPWAMVGRWYAPPPLGFRGTARCPESDTNFTAQGLPAGLAMDGTGQIEGTPRQIGVYRVAVQAANSCGASTTPLTLVVAGAPILLVSASVIEFHYLRGTRPPESRTISVASSWPDLEYSLTRAAPWLKVTPRRGRTPSSGAAADADHVELSVSPGGLLPGVYDSEITVAAWQGVNAPRVLVRLTVE